MSEQNFPPKGIPRTLIEMRDVAMDSVLLADKPDMDLYFMNRDILKNETEFRLDETTIIAIKIGVEFNKTYGHEHKCAELYEIISGAGYFLMQRRDGEDIEEIFIVPARTGEKVYVPPKYGHLMINSTDESLVTRNIMFKKSVSDYKPFKEHHGAGYYAIDSGEAVEWVINKSWPKVTPIKMKTLAQLFKEFQIDKAKEPLSELILTNNKILNLFR